ncbi:MAG: hypothetical protein Pars2KO_22900 [Parasphingorhabdus sp.]
MNTNTPWQDRFPVDAALLPFSVDVNADQVILVRLSEEDYRNISFLDQRIITPQLPRQVVDWEEIAAIPISEQSQPHYIFHIGHVGSTLISRLLGEHQTILALREPAILRQISDLRVTNNEQAAAWNRDNFVDRLNKTQNWLSRSFHPNQTVMIKASSFVSPLAENLLGNSGKALFLYTSFERYLQTILAGEASIREADALVDLRLLRVNRYLEHDQINKSDLSPVQKIGLGWICEMTTLTRAFDNLKQATIRWMDFDSFLSDPTAQLKIATDHFDLEISTQNIADLVSGPIMNSYSKAPEYDYSPSLREDLLAEAAQNHFQAIRDTMHWIEKMAKDHKAIARAMEQVETRP